MNTQADLLDNAPRRNIELKARLQSLRRAREIARSLDHERLPDQHQTDTYFHCRRGRLKLREIKGVGCELISYERPDELESKLSRYHVVPVESARELCAALDTVLGIRCRVEKHREIYLHRNVRVHLDSVSRLGEFLEFEAVLDEQDEGLARALVAELRDRFSISAEDLITNSYGDLIESLSGGSISRAE